MKRAACGGAVERSLTLAAMRFAVLTAAQPRFTESEASAEQGAKRGREDLFTPRTNGRPLIILAY
ncbi:MAG TPA: hypothetical protein VIP11_23670, partial [Gemmatimonadaceae bacterium]